MRYDLEKLIYMVFGYDSTSATEGVAGISLCC